MARLQHTQGTYESYAHKLLWDSSLRHLQIASERAEDEWCLSLSAGLLGAAAFEAYLNYVGEEILPQVWSTERVYFSKEPYRGTFGKLRRIAEEIHWPLPRSDRQPLAGVIELQALRDKIVHGRVKKVQYSRVHKEGTNPPMPLGWLQGEAPPKKVRLLLAHTQTFAETLHAALRTSEFRFCILGAHPFLGMLGLGSRTISAA